MECGLQESDALRRANERGVEDKAYILFDSESIIVSTVEILRDSSKRWSELQR